MEFFQRVRTKFRKLLEKKRDKAKNIFNLTLIKLLACCSFSNIAHLISETFLYQKKLILKLLFQHLFILSR